MIDISFDEMLELARQAELQKQVEADMESPLAQVFPDFCVIETTRSVLDNQGYEIPAGAQGTVLDPLGNGVAYIVEFTDPAYQNSERWGLADLPPEAMRVVWVPGDSATLPEDLHGKLGEAEEEGGSGRPSGNSPQSGRRG